jgi:hypothetical protein
VEKEKQKNRSISDEEAAGRALSQILKNLERSGTFSIRIKTAITNMHIEMCHAKTC